MTGELGQLALCLALALSLVQALAGFIGASKNSVRVMAMGRGAALGSFVFIALAFFTLMFAYVTSDFSVLAVAQNSHTAKPLIYKISGVWGNHEGSMVLWILILGAYSAAIALTQPGDGQEGTKLGARTLAVQALIAIAFLIFILLTSDPFERFYPPPFEGNGLNPLLQASLMPWLVATALIHSMMATERTGAFKSWTLLLAITAFSFSLIGTFLVRSGVLNSVHAFANDPRRGFFILVILFFAITLPLILFAWRAPKLTPGAPFDVASRETGIMINNFLLTASAVIILAGTLYPLVLDAAEGIKISVGPPYYTAMVIPLMAVLAMAMPFGPIMMWRRGNLPAALYSLRFAGAAALVVLLAVLAIVRPVSALGVLATGLGTWLIAGSVTDLARRAGSFRRVRHLGAGAWSVALAHAGLGVVAFGVAGTAIWKSEATEVLAPGKSMNVAAYELRLDSIERVQGPNYVADRANITVSTNGRPLTVIHPEKRQYPVEQMATSNSSIRTTVISDLYVVLSEPRDGGGWVVRAYVNPLAPFIWLGAVVMAMAGFIAIGARIAARVRAARSEAAAGVTEPAS